MMIPRRLAALTLIAITVVSSIAQDETPAQRGKKDLEGRAFTPAPWSWKTYDEVWKLWNPAPAEKPADYVAAFRDRYGLSPAPYENNGLPMGLREGKTLLGFKGITNDCMLCHGGSILGKSYVGLGNSSLDVQAFFEDFNKFNGLPSKLPFTFSNVRGTSEAGGMAVYLLSHREPNLDVRFRRLELGLRDNLCEDPPAWWLLKKKQTMYHTGTSHAKSVRSIMQFMLSPTNPRAVFEREEKTFQDIQAHLFSLEAPKYPYPIDADLAREGHALFKSNCAKCHGTYGAEPTYPNKIVPLEVIGTDRARFDGFSREVGAHYNRSWFSKEKGDDGYLADEPSGYQAPPLDGVWATAPYLHNGSVPTLYDLLDSKHRPKLYTRSFRTDAEDYDAVNIGWNIRALKSIPENLTPHERRKIYDTTQPGRGNQGHTFGDAFTDAERRAVIEYLKGL